MKALTKRQQQVLDFIRDTLLIEQMPPTRGEIARHLGFRSANAAEDHLKALMKKGAITILPGQSRGIRLTEHTAQNGIPLVGHVAAGTAILALEHIEDYIPLPRDFFQAPVSFFLRVVGLSMKNIGMLDGDLIAVEQTREAKNGDIVVARIDDEVTVKRFEKTNNHILLRPENDDFDIIKVDAQTQDLHIEGRVVGVIRRNISCNY